jgi:hypothetical protein
MAVSLMREVSLHRGVRGFYAEFHADEEHDKGLYQSCVALENDRFVNGSFAQRVFERLSSPSISKDSEKTITPVSAVI